MSTPFDMLCQDLTKKIRDSYESGVTLDEAEKLAGEFLYAQIQVSVELKKADLSSRMRKSGLRAIRAAIYMEAATKDPKKPSDVMLEQMVNLNDIVQGEQTGFDEAESELDELERYYNIFREAHIFFRGVSKGKFE